MDTNKHESVFIVAPVLFRCLALFVSVPLLAQSPKILQIYRDRLKPGSMAAYTKIEEDVVRICARMKCPHSYTAIKTANEVWYLNAYESTAEQQKVAQDYAKNPQLLAEMGRVVAPKADVVFPPKEFCARYQDDLSTAGALNIGTARFLLITVTHDYEDARMIIQAMPDKHFVYAVTSGMPEGTLLVLTPVDSRQEAAEVQKRNATMASETYLFERAPAMSYAMER